MKRPPDAVDAEAIREVLQLRGWKLIQERLVMLRDNAITELIQPHAESETVAIRGRIEAFRTALAVPDAIMSEGKAYKDNGNQLDRRSEAKKGRV